ncbi:proheparin-binding EGF-like growth factor [Anguilla anguilla]|uniref:proheparin-binding EGF-like growth factor n=1 Tax=Anguilla anguilla TaxID=7936 RepID=UPI0015AB60BD|nr:proheparin-binding EGF-like growth factor [Anguilla anguilla]
MKIFGVLVLLIHALAASRLVSGASIDRHESEKPAHTAVVNLFAPLDESTVAGDTGEVQDGGVDEYYYDDEEDEVSLSGDYGIEQPRVAFSSKPRDPSAVQGPEPSEGTERRGKGRKRGKGKGKGKKRNPCLRKYKDFCIHGTCQYLRDIRMPSCICQPDYSGERCHLFSLPTSRNEDSYSRTTALAVVAVVLSSLCLTVIAILLAIRYHKRGAYDVENEEKVKLGSVPQH